MSGHTSKIGRMIQQIVRDMETVRPDELGELGRIGARLERIGDEAGKDRPVVVEAIESLSRAVEMVILDEYGDADDPLAVIGRGIEALQRMQTAFEETGRDALDDPGPIQEVQVLAGMAAGSERNGTETSEPEPEAMEAGVVEKEAEAADVNFSVSEIEEAMPKSAADATETAENTPEAEGAPEDAATAKTGAEQTGDGEDISDILEQIALDIMTVDLADLSGVGDILNNLEDMTDRFKASRPVYAGLSASLSVALEKVALDECEDKEAALDAVARGVAMLQRLQAAFDRGEQEVADDRDLLQEITTLAGTETGIDLSGAEDQGGGMPGGAGAGEAAETAEDPVMADPGRQPQQPAAPEAPLVDADIFFDFALEAEEHLSAAETNLLSLEDNPDDAETLNAVFRSFHTIKGAAGFLNLNDVAHVAHDVEDVLDLARKGKLKLNAAILDVAFESIDLLKTLIGSVKAQLAGETVQKQDVPGFLEKVRQVTEGNEPPAGRPAGGNGAAQRDGTGGGPSPPRDSGKSAENKRKDQLFVRVGTEKLDQLINMVGELVISQTQVTQNPEIVGSTNQKLNRDVAQLDRITRDLQEIAMSMRMVPIKGTFERMARMVRDLARKCGKQVGFRMSGEDTELDKNVVDELIDPLTHMVRNAVDHGIEPAGEREAAGKPPKGVVTLEAYHQGGNIVIELQDDGKGLDREKIRKKAIDRGLIRPEEDLTDAHVYDFIFHPGFSTAEKVSDVSGRGVGMDVVRRSIEKLRGKVEVHSEPGNGSTFTIRLPLTLAIIDGMIIGVGRERYVLPLTSIVRSLRPAEEQVFTVMGEGEMVKVHDDLYPLLRLYERFGVSPDNRNPWEALVVLIESEGGSCCLLVDELLGIQQVVIKGLDDDLRHDKGLSGCTILGDGRVGLILDANGLVGKTNHRGSSQTIKDLETVASGNGQIVQMAAPSMN